MTAKQYLSQCFQLNNRIEAHQLEVERLKELMNSIPSHDMTKSKVKGDKRTDRLESIVIKIVDLEKKIEDEIDKLVDTKTEIIERIEAMPDDKLKVMLQKRYINFLKFSQIANDMNYTNQRIYQLHNLALNKFNSLYLKD